MIRNRLGQSFGWSAAFLAVSAVYSAASVPLVLRSLGSGLYSAWVIAGSLIMVQGLVDFGAAAVTVRGVASAAAHESRPAVLAVLRRSLAFYGVLSAIVVTSLVVWAPNIVQLVTHLHGASVAKGAIIVRYAAVAFAVTNITAALGALLQGVNRVDSFFKFQTIGWLVYLPGLAVGLAAGWGTKAPGIAWVTAYGLQLVLVIVGTVGPVRELSERPAAVQSLREMAKFGGRYQISSWADFSTFQLPRLVGGAALSSGGLVTLDVALRAAQLVVAPVMAFAPVVLPTVMNVWTRYGSAALRELLVRWATIGLMAVLLGTSISLPLIDPVLALWTGRHISSFPFGVTSIILIGLAGHSSTCLFTSTLVALGRLREIVLYKCGQLVAGVALLALAAAVWPPGIAPALGTAFLIPAVIFNFKAAERLGVWPAVRDDTPWAAVALFAAALIGLPLLMSDVLSRAAPAWQILGVRLAISTAIGVVAFAWLRRFLSTAPWRRAPQWAASQTTTADRAA